MINPRTERSSLLQHRCTYNLINMLRFILHNLYIQNREKMVKIRLKNKILQLHSWLASLTFQCLCPLFARCLKDQRIKIFLVLVWVYIVMDGHYSETLQSSALKKNWGRDERLCSSPATSQEESDNYTWKRLLDTFEAQIQNH